MRALSSLLISILEAFLRDYSIDLKRTNFGILNLRFKQAFRFLALPSFSLKKSEDPFVLKTYLLNSPLKITEHLWNSKP
jgi:hypothetical protein